MDVKTSVKIKNELIIINVIVMLGTLLMILNGYLVGLLLWWGLKMAAKKKTKKKSKSRVNEAGNYTKPAMRKRLFNKIKAGTKGGKAGQWSARKAQLLASEYKKAGGGYK